jgi:hypothetical protein
VSVVEVAVSLKGSFETLALPEVLQLLADTSKTGELCVKGEGGPQARLWFRDGAIAAFDVEGSYEPNDAIFEMLGVSRGEFWFQTGSDVPGYARTPGSERHDVRAELGSAQAKMSEWVEILAVVPSLEHRVHLSPGAPADHVSVDRSQWEMLVAIGEGRTVSEVLSARNLGRFDGCKAVKGLLDSRLIYIAEPEQPQPVEGPSVGEPEVRSAPSADKSAEPVENAPVPVGQDDAVEPARHGLEAETKGQVGDDGLGDRGPWTPRELESMGGWEGDSSQREAAESSPKPAEAPEDSESTPTEESIGKTPEDPAPADEPTHRGRFLKRRSSVRN